jgi:superoxide dismutase
MNITKIYNEKELTLSIESRTEATTSSNLDKKIDEEFGDFNSLIMNFTDLKYISSVGL